jgi:hypothetical protein
MPTGYTDTIKAHTTARDFLLTCARAFGACVMQREDPLTDPPKAPAESDYYAKTLAERRAALDKALSMRDSEWKRDNDTSFASRLENRIERKRERDARRAVLARVRAEVEGWVPPTPDHEGVKRFALEQIAVEAGEGDYLDEMPVAIPWQQHRDESIAEARRGVEYAERNLREERERTASRNEWIRDLYASLGGA